MKLNKKLYTMIKKRVVDSWRSSIVGIVVLGLGVVLVIKDQIAFGSVLIPVGLGLLGYKETKS